MDLEAEGSQLALELLEALHRRKTGALIAASTEAGAVLGGADDATGAELHAIGELIGLAFQIRDDLLSLEGDEAGMGKTLATDIEKAKSTFPRLLGIEGARAHGQEVVNEIEQRVTALALPEAGLLLEFAQQALARSN
jgi:geranylgeranyl pyrophosphate synthase